MGKRSNREVESGSETSVSPPDKWSAASDAHATSDSDGGKSPTPVKQKNREHHPKDRSSKKKGKDKRQKHREDRESPDTKEGADRRRERQKNKADRVEVKKHRLGTADDRQVTLERDQTPERADHKHAGRGREEGDRAGRRRDSPELIHHDVRHRGPTGRETSRWESRRDELGGARAGRSPVEEGSRHRQSHRQERQRGHRQKQRRPDRSRSPTRERHRGRWESPVESGAVRVKQEPVSDDEGGRGRDRRERHDGHRGEGGGRGRSGREEQRGAEATAEPPVEEKLKPDFGLSGKLTEDSNTVNGVVVKYSEPPEARRPRRRWRLYVFKGEQEMPTLHIHRQSAFLMGRDRKVADIPIDHPSCSKQHAALQYRLVAFQREDGSSGRRIRPYIIDLDSANGTYVNNKRIEPKRYVELMERDVIKFGFSSREYVLLHEHSKDDEDDVIED